MECIHVELSCKGGIIVEDEYDFIRYLIMSESIEGLIRNLKIGCHDDEDYEIQLSNGNIIKIKNIIYEIEKWNKCEKTFTDIMAELIYKYCPMIEYYT